jgi:serine/threonine protein kinase
LSRYTLVETLGGGGTSVVHRAQVAGGLPDVALKQLRPQFAADPTLCRRFLREADLARRLDHPGIVRVLDAGEEGGMPFLVTELMQGETLRARLEREERLAPDEAVPIFTSLARALEHSHQQGVIHRDVKPENIFLTDAGAKLGDFGNARVVSLASVTGASLSWGTPEYVAPEVFMRGRADPRADLYSLGVVFYEMLSGQLPWSRSETLARLTGGSVSKVAAPSDTSPEIASVLADLLAFSPGDRPASAAETLARLSHPAEVALASSTCATCGATRGNDVPRCLSCGHESLRVAHSPEGRWKLVLERLDDDPVAMARLLSLLDPIAERSSGSLQFLTGPRSLYSAEEVTRAIALPAILFSELDAETARSLAALFNGDGVEVRAVEGNRIGRSRLAPLKPENPWRFGVAFMSFCTFVAIAGRASHAAQLLVALSMGSSVLIAVALDRWKKRRLPPAGRGVFLLRDDIASGPVAEALLAGATATVGAVRAPEVRALLSDVVTELYRVTRRAEQLAAKSAGPSSETDLLRRTADAAPALLDGLRRMAARLDDLDAALDGHTEGELMRALARLDRAATVPGADPAALAATRQDVEGTLERRHAAEQERAGLSAKLCQLLGHLRVVYREAATMDTAADRDARALEAASAELDALLAAPAAR